MASRIGIHLAAEDIDRSHRIAKRTEQRSQNTTYAGAAQQNGSSTKKPSPIIVKFTSYKHKQKFIQNRRKLKGTGTVIIEDLTKRNGELLSQTSKNKKVSASWSMDGRIFAMVKSTNGNETRKLITSLSDLRSL